MSFSNSTCIAMGDGPMGVGISSDKSEEFEVMESYYKNKWNTRWKVVERRHCGLVESVRTWVGT